MNASPETLPDPDDLDLSQLLVENRNRLHRMVQLRLDRRLQGRVDASDVIQEAFLEATERLDEYQRDPKLPPFFVVATDNGPALDAIASSTLGSPSA